MLEVEYRPELLAPAGTFDSLKAAINAGADAVYLAGERFGARAYAGNFTEEELLRAIKYARIFDVKIYLTVNTLIKERELGDLLPFIKPFYEAGLSGVIVQDIGAVKVIHEAFPKLFISASTQMTVTTAAEANMLKGLGISRVIPARELSLQEIRELCAGTDVEVETFIHGAMCYAYSGQCLFSSMLGDRSANRGRCAGPCRMEYSIGGGAPKYMLSLRDMVTIDYIPELIEAGVKSFKIEGRMKPPEYVAGVTSVYRKYIDLCVRGTEALSHVCVRGTEALSRIDAQRFPRETVPLKVLGNIPVGELGLHSTTELYTDSKRFSDSTGKLCIDDCDREILSKVYVRTGPGPGYLTGKKGAAMISLDSPAYTKSDEEILARIREKYIECDRKIPVKIRVSLAVGEPAVLAVSSGDVYREVTGDVVDAAKTAPLSKEKIKEAVEKLGGTVFYPTSVEVETLGNVFLPISKIKELRRRALEELEDDLCKSKE